MMKAATFFLLYPFDGDCNVVNKGPERINLTEAAPLKQLAEQTGNKGVRNFDILDLRRSI